MDDQGAGFSVEIFLSLVQRRFEEEIPSQGRGEIKGYGSEDETSSGRRHLDGRLSETGPRIQFSRPLVHEGIFIEDSIQGGSGKFFHQLETGTLDDNLNKRI